MNLAGFSHLSRRHIKSEIRVRLSWHGFSKLHSPTKRVDSNGQRENTEGATNPERKPYVLERPVASSGRGKRRSDRSLELSGVRGMLMFGDLGRLFPKSLWPAGGTSFFWKTTAKLVGI